METKTYKRNETKVLENFIIILLDCFAFKVNICHVPQEYCQKDVLIS